MGADQPRSSFPLHRWISALLFLSVFFLPLHIHVATAATAQLSKECSCMQGTRTQLGAVGSGPALSTPVQSSSIVVRATLVWTRDRSGPQNVRAPPLFASL